ncbi:MAG: RNA pseudouridine synthase [Fimbriiglobus sp.]|nr:RNA pseudouridine synthase [Fimbriiglobus sp.]
MTDTVSEALDPTRLLFEDHHLLVVNKPAPLLTQAPPTVPSLEAMVKAYIKKRYQKPAGVYLGVPHRLDRAVSGVVCFARNTKAAQRVHAQFAEHTTKKVYWAVVEGEGLPDAGVWDDWLVKKADVAETVVGREGEPGAKLAMLGYRVMRRMEGMVLLELSPLTGRMHQLRVQCASRGHPVLGDEKYGSKTAFGPPGELPRERVIALHARQLTLTHPFTKQEMTWIAEVPAYWGELTGSPLV